MWRERVQDVLRTSGQPLDASVRRQMEAGLGHDFGRVRIHADDRAADSAGAIHALAYTSGHHIVFGEGQYSAGSPDGQRLLRHELAHVIQQTSGLVQHQGEMSVGDPNDRFEREADRIASQTQLA